MKIYTAGILLVLLLGVINSDAKTGTITIKSLVKDTISILLQPDLSGSSSINLSSPGSQPMCYRAIRFNIGPLATVKHFLSPTELCSYSKAEITASDGSMSITYLKKPLSFDTNTTDYQLSVNFVHGKWDIEIISEKHNE